MIAVTVPLVHVTSPTPRTRLVVIDVQGVPLDFVAGQAMLIGGHGQAERRPYSIAGSPERTRETSCLELLMSVEADGKIGPHLPDVTPGTRIDIEGPYGTFTFPEGQDQKRLLFVAGGTGIAPLRSMLDHALRRHPTQRISVLYSARRSDEFAFIEELREHERERRIALHQTVTRDESASWSGGRGRIGRGHFEAVLPEPLNTLCFVCGPPALVSESAAMLKALGVPDAAIRTEGWGG